MLHDFLNPDDVPGAMRPPSAPPTAGDQSPAPATHAELQQVTGTVQQFAPFTMAIGNGSAPVYIVLSQTAPAPACPLVPAPAAEPATLRPLVPAPAAPAVVASKKKTLATVKEKSAQQDTGGGMDRVAAWLLTGLTAIVLLFIAGMAVREVDTEVLTRVSVIAVSVVVVLAGVVFRKPIGRRLRGTRKVIGVVADVTIASAQIVKKAVVGETGPTVPTAGELAKDENTGPGDHPDPADPA